MRLRVVGLVVLLAAAGCAAGADTVSVGPRQPGEQDVTVGLEVWEDFPVRVRPRPLVVIGPGVSAPADGFPDSGTKEAWLASAIDLPRGLPAGPGTAAGRPVMTAAEAGRRLGEDPARRSATRLVVTGARLGTATVLTDRGQRRLPACFFGLRGVRGEASVLAVADSARFVPHLPDDAGVGYDSVTAGRDGRTLTLRFTGAPDDPGPCGFDYAVDATETATAVALTVRARPHLGGDDEAVCPTVAVSRQADARLARPLGDRVAITPAGAPLPVS